MSGARGFAGIVVAMALWFAAPASAARWTVLPSPDDGVLNAVACTSPTACTAVGLVGIPAGPGSILAERWNGRSWSVQPEVHPRWRGQSEWTAGSCAGPRFCIAIGEVVFASRSAVGCGASSAFGEGVSGRCRSLATADQGQTSPFKTRSASSPASLPRFCVAGGWGLTSRLPPGSASSARKRNGRRWAVIQTARG